jgi:hypothetical protein
VRPKFEPTPTDAEPEVPDAPARATSDDMVKARHAVQRASDEPTLRKFRAKVEKRLIDEGFYTDAQADELLALIDGKLDYITGEEVAS